jgi:hypothetical protein
MNLSFTLSNILPFIKIHLDFSKKVFRETQLAINGDDKLRQKLNVTFFLPSVFLLCLSLFNNFSQNAIILTFKGYVENKKKEDETYDG